MRDTNGRNAPQVKAVEEYVLANRVDIRAIGLDVASQRSADEAVTRIVAENGRLDVVIHNAGHMVFGPAEAFPARTTGGTEATKRVNDWFAGGANQHRQPDGTSV